MGRELRAFKSRYYPTAEQEAILLRSMGATRRIWNWGLALRTTAWEERKERVSSIDLTNLLPQLKKEPGMEWLGEISSVVLQQVLRDLDQAFSNYFASLKGTRKGPKVRYPRFKSRAMARKSLRYVRTGFRFKDDELTLAKMNEPLAIVWSRPLPEGKVPSSITVSCDSAGRWFATMLVEDDIVQLAPTGSVLRSVGIDLGLKSFAVFSDGTIGEHPKLLRKSEARLARYQRRFAKTQKGSKNREKARVKVARTHVKVADQRRDFLHKLSTYIIQTYDIIAIESLATANMMRNHCLARAIADSSWSSLRVMLTYKSIWYGRELIAVDRWLASSRICNNCRWYNHELKLSDRTWFCLGCSTLLDRDLNAAKNILAEGLSVLSETRLARNVCFEGLDSLGLSGEGRPTVEVNASISPSTLQDVARTRCSHMNQKPSMVKESYAVA
jgi:putative transposase